MRTPLQNKVLSRRHCFWISPPTKYGIQVTPAFGTAFPIQSYFTPNPHTHVIISKIKKFGIPKHNCKLCLFKMRFHTLYNILREKCHCREDEQRTGWLVVAGFSCFFIFYSNLFLAPSTHISKQKPCSYPEPPSHSLPPWFSLAGTLLLNL